MINSKKAAWKGRNQTAKEIGRSQSKQGYYITSAGNTEGENKTMERVNEIRADIAENAAHLTNKMLLQDLSHLAPAQNIGRGGL